jgi:hypothetical protein
MAPERDLCRAEREVRQAVAELTQTIPSKVEIYRKALEQYRTAVMSHPDIEKALRRTLTECLVCDQRCPGLPACQQR